jgi:hypothetical protein
MGVCLIADNFEELRINYDEKIAEEEKAKKMKENFISGQKIIKINEIEIEKIKKQRLLKKKTHDMKNLNISTNSSLILLGVNKKAKTETNSENKIIGTQTFKSKKYDIVNYPKDVLVLINKIRCDPQSFVNDIEIAMTNIQEYNNRLIYNGGIKVKLNKGENMFKDAIDYLRKTKSMSPLTLNKEIEIEMPTDEEYKKEKDFFKQKILTKKKENKIERYYREAIKDPYTGVLMMIVDDTSRNQGEKRVTILDPLLNKISINCKMYGKKFLAYLTFSK